jgi:predicted TIM-barrel fold metal-dependent hydrolase
MLDQWIDVHAHFYPPETEEEIHARWDAMKQLCWTSPAPPRWNPETTLAYMDEAGVAMQILSNIPKSHDKLRASNDYGSSLVKKYPSRFGFLAAIPTDEPEAALAEIKRASEDLNPDGFAVTFRYNGVYLSDSRMEGDQAGRPLSPLRYRKTRYAIPDRVRTRCGHRGSGSGRR